MQTEGDENMKGSKEKGRGRSEEGKEHEDLLKRTWAG